MKTRNQVRTNGSSKATAQQGKINQSFYIILICKATPRADQRFAEDDLDDTGESFKLSESEWEAIKLLAKWESESPAEFIRKTAMARLEASYDDLISAAVHEKGKPKERAWAQKFYSRVKVLMDSLQLMPSREAAVKGGAR